MNDVDFLSKVSKANSLINFNELRKTLFEFPVTEFNDFDNLDLILTSKEVASIDSAKDLIFFIENRSKKLKINTLKAKAQKEKKQNEELIKKLDKKKKQDEKLFFSILKSQGMLTGSNGSECYGCGFIPTSNGKCSC